MTEVRDRDVHHADPAAGRPGDALGLVAALPWPRSCLPVQRAVPELPRPWALLAGGAADLPAGALDDRWGLDALTKLAGQVLAAGRDGA